MKGKFLSDLILVLVTVTKRTKRTLQYFCPCDSVLYVGICTMTSLVASPDHIDKKTVTIRSYTTYLTGRKCQWE